MKKTNMHGKSRRTAMKLMVTLATLTLVPTTLFHWIPNWMNRKQVRRALAISKLLNESGVKTGREANELIAGSNIPVRISCMFYKSDITFALSSSGEWEVTYDAVPLGPFETYHYDSETWKSSE